MRACVHFGENLKQYDNMSEQESQSSPMRTTEASHRNSTTLKDSMDEGAANNSIIGKVKSRVSSIFPNSLSKWFSPSSAKNNNNDSPNGSVSVGGITRRRRRLDIDEDDDDDDEDIGDEDAEDDDGDEEHELGEYDENLIGHQQDDEDNSDDESNNSEEATAVITTSGFKIASRREALRPCATAVRQPPSKRSRFNLDITTPTTTIRNTPLMQRKQIVSSTPATGANNFRSTSINLSTGTGMGRSAANRYTHLNLYGNQGRKEAAFNFQSSSITNTNLTLLGGRSVTDPIELETEQANHANMQSDIMSSRRSLNIPPATLASTERYAGLSNLKRQALSNIKHEYSNTSSLPRRTSTTIFENDAGDDYTEPQQRSSQLLHEAQLEREVNEDDEYETQQSKSFNGRLIDNVAYKRQKLTNGADDALTITAETFTRAGAANIRDSASESSDGGVNSGVGDSVGVVGLTTGRAEIAAGSSGQAKRRAAGLFNLSAANSSRNGSRTSSFGNGLNFYTHLEGRKSLFAGTQSAASGQQNLNNSTLSLTSLNRRQFNASIYGSTSALSDSRLLNTFSPFYKGKTTYGGASAYNKYSLLGTGAGANSAVRITPTLIRPTSSLSTLSSSNNSLTTAAVGVNASAENSSALSSTAKRILDLINDFATPLSDAKKMASNLKASQQQQNQPQFAKSRRFNDADLNTTRAVRLSQVRSPYMRPTVTLHPTPKTNLSKHNAVLPPVRELQVPSMSQLLQMKKMQSTTERSRRIATENSYKITAQQPLAATSLSEYTLPVELHSDKQKHTNKIKNKVTSSVRVTASKDAADDAPPFTVNLPNIAFPIMQSAPKFDISLPNTSVTKSPTSSALGGGDAAKSSFGKNETVSTIAFKAIDVVDNTTKKVATTATPGISTTLPKTNFTFSAPLQLDGIYPQNVSPINGNYKFSAPMIIQRDGSNSQYMALNSPVNQSQSLSVQLKSGSVLDALKKPLTIPTTKIQSSADNSLASQFKKSTNEWDCDTCMIRNKQELSKCAACETPRKSTAPVDVQTISPLTSLNPAVSGFGNQFKKIPSEWECDTCMIRNKQDVNKCVACETSRPYNSGNSNSSSKKSSVSFPALVSGPSFGDTFKPKANTWECPTCLVNNKNESFECVACQTKKTGSTNSVAAKVKIDVPPLSSDDGFVSLAASQKASKWECEACMTRNDTTRLKCVCCEQAKPGSQTVSEDVPKFSFGSTAAAKFSFGFGGATSTAPKEAELRKNENAEKKTDTTTTTITAPSTGFVFGKAVSAIPNQIPGFTFGAKPVDDASTSENKDIAKDVADNSKPSVLTDFKFGNTTPSSLVTSNVSTSTTTATTTGLTSATNIDTVSTIRTSTPNVVKFSSPTAIAVASKNSNAAPTFTFGSSSTPATSTSNPVQQPTSGFSFGLSKPSETAAVDAVSRAAKETPTNGGFAFNAPIKTATTTNTLTFGITPATTTVTTTIAAPTATIKPLFSFSSTTSSTSTSTASAAQTTLSNTAQSTGGFSFGNMAASSSTPAEKKSLFGAAMAPTSTTTAAAATTTSVIKNVFGSFGAAPTTSNVFGVAAVPSTTSSSTTTAAAFNTSSTFGSLASSTAVSSSPQFGIFGNSETTGKSKPTTLFGASSSVTPSSNTPFAFGSTTATNSNAITTTPSTTWPKNSFVFGSPAVVAPTPVMSNETSKQTQQQQHSFGGFGTSSTPASIVNPTASSSIFGNLATVAPTTGTFGSVTGATPIFSSNPSVTAAGSSGSVNNNNLFGSAMTSNSSNSTSAFGITPFGGGNSALATTFGSAATASSGGPPTSNSFGGFGSLSSGAIAGNTTDGASAAKKSDTTFSFGGANQAASQSASGGFNFGSSAAIAKPAFNFGASTAATPGSFNFTGSVETTKSTTQPFQFGATPLAPVFNFSGGAAVETTPNAPFQFNAGAASPAASNIFAPAASVPGTQSAQQARRKIRAPTRRLTPR